MVLWEGKAQLQEGLTKPPFPPFFAISSQLLSPASLVLIHAAVCPPAALSTVHECKQGSGGYYKAQVCTEVLVATKGKACTGDGGALGC